MPALRAGRIRPKAAAEAAEAAEPPGKPKRAIAPREIDLSETGLTELPRPLLENELAVSRLGLARNRLADLPAPFARCVRAHLEELDLADNPLAVEPAPDAPPPAAAAAAPALSETKKNRPTHEHPPCSHATL